MSEFPEHIYRSAMPATTRTWREKAGRHRLIGVRCPQCGEKYFPRRPACPACGSRELVPYQCARKGRIVCLAPQMPLLRPIGYADLPFPRLIAIIRLDDGIHLEAELIEASEEEAAPGIPVRMVVRKLRRQANGDWLYGYKFVIDRIESEQLI
jgi:scaffold protein (connect acetoacetyl-CoA thiolase and HMG-CoA synthase)